MDDKRLYMPESTPYYCSERAWLDHLRIMAELPYSSWALMPSIVSVLRQHFSWDFIAFGWDDKQTLQPLGYWARPIVGEILKTYADNFSKFAQDMPLDIMLESHGRVLRMAEESPEYEQTQLYKDLLAPYGVRWGMAVPVYLGEDGLGFFGVFRKQAHGRYEDADQDRMDKVSIALSDLDRRQNPLASLPPAEYREAVTATMLLHKDGRILAQSPAAHDMLFLSRNTGMGSPEWVRQDWYALPPEASEVVGEMFADDATTLRREVRQLKPWGRFDFVLEKMPFPSEGNSIVNVIIRHHEPLDIAIARGLWGWPLSPQEKRILIASARNPSRSQLAQALGLAEGTLKSYINEMQNRFQVKSRQELIDRIVHVAA